MALALHGSRYTVVALLLLGWGGNIACRSLLGALGNPPAKALSAAQSRAGRIIGSLERSIIAIGLISESWEVLAAVIALKSIARFKELDDMISAEYFLVGSLFSVLWAMIVTGAWVTYDHHRGVNIRSAIAAVVAGDTPVVPQPVLQFDFRWDATRPTKPDDGNAATRNDDPVAAGSPPPAGQPR